jgi:hypothetical protein
MHHPDDMGEAIVLGSRKNIIRETELPDPSQSLEKGRVDDLLFPFRDRYEAVEDIVDDSLVFGTSDLAFIRMSWKRVQEN